MSTVSVCAIVRDEAKYLLEWIAYYTAIGADRFVIYDNDSTDGSRDLLLSLARGVPITVLDWSNQPSVDRELPYADVHQFVTSDDALQVRDWHAVRWISPQICAYNHALAHFGGDCDWMLFVDADEFVTPVRDRTIKEFIARCAAREDAAAIAINEKYFGSAGLREYEDIPVIERFTRCAVPRFDGHLHIKSLVRPACVASMVIHGARLKSGTYVNDMGQPIEIQGCSFSSEISMYYAQVNHYSVKSRAEFAAKIRKGRASVSDDHINSMWDMNDDYFVRQDRNEDEDVSIQRFLAATRHNMEVLRSTLHTP